MKTSFRLFLVSVIGLAAFLLVINADKSARPVLNHPLFEGHVLGSHYFVNDLVGVSPQQAALPLAYVLSHSSRAAVMIADGNGHRLVPADDYGLSQDESVKGWGGQDKHVDSDGILHLYYFRTFIVGDYKPRKEGSHNRHLRVAIPWSANHSQSGGIDIESYVKDDKTTLEIEFNDGGRFWIETLPPPSDGFAIEFDLRGFHPGEVLIGEESDAVSSERFSLSTKDLHSLAVTELDGDEGPEFSVVRGGVRGRIGEVDPAAKDLLVDSDTISDQSARYPGFIKNGCPGRQSAWVDIDSDGDLDLYVSCGRPEQPAALSPNQLFIRSVDDFVESAEKFGIGFYPYGSFKFIDWDGDLDPDLWWADANGELHYFVNQNGRFEIRKTFTGAWRGSHRSPQLLIRDLTMNGKPDLLVAHKSGGGLIVNNNKPMEFEKLSKHGLPDASLAVHVADVDLDGQDDLMTATQGVYLNNGSLQFAKLEAEIDDELFISDARLVSFDSEQGRQFLLGYRVCLPGKFCGARRVILSNLRKYFPMSLAWMEMFGLIEPYNWTLQTLNRKKHSITHREVAISLQGTESNPFALGARIDLTWNGQRSSHWVSESESSLYSSADLSIYFSAPVSTPVQGEVFWSDKCSVKFDLPVIQERLHIMRPENCSNNR